MRNVCQHLKNRSEYFKDLNKMLRCDGKVVIIENEKKNISFNDNKN